MFPAIYVVVSMSKIQSESNSQQCRQQSAFKYCCGFYVKDTIWKQFTTDELNLSSYLWLWFLCQRYNLKAIHNYPIDNINGKLVVVSMSKIQSESNSQQSGMESAKADGCGFYVKDTIWKQFTTINKCLFSSSWLWFLCQRYNLKAIHNNRTKTCWSAAVVVSMSKIQSESNSQHPRLYQLFPDGCGFYVKDTIWKQFTTMKFKRRFNRWLWFLCQRYNLKAIHNK